MWTAWSPQGCYRICLVDKNFKNLPAGNVVDKLIYEWGRAKISGTTDQSGILEVSLFHGDYKMEINHPIKKNYSTIHHLQVLPKDESNKTAQLKQLFV
jgi:hypothetical protein